MKCRLFLLGPIVAIAACADDGSDPSATCSAAVSEVQITGSSGRVRIHAELTGSGRCEGEVVDVLLSHRIGVSGFEPTTALVPSSLSGGELGGSGQIRRLPVGERTTLDAEWNTVAEGIGLAGPALVEVRVDPAFGSPGRSDPAEIDNSNAYRINVSGPGVEEGESCDFVVRLEAGQQLPSVTIQGVSDDDSSTSSLCVAPRAGGWPAPFDIDEATQCAETVNGTATIRLETETPFVTAASHRFDVVFASVTKLLCLDVRAGAASAVTFTSEIPSSAILGDVIDVEGSVVDALGNVIPSDDLVVELETESGASTMSEQATTSSGIVDFGPRVLGQVGTTRLRLQSAGLTGAMTAIEVVPPAPVITMTGSPTVTSQGSSASTTVPAPGAPSLGEYRINVVAPHASSIECAEASSSQVRIDDPEIGLTTQVLPGGLLASVSETLVLIEGRVQRRVGVLDIDCVATNESGSDAKSIRIDFTLRAGYTDCDGLAVDTDTDVNHCGACNFAVVQGTAPNYRTCNDGRPFPGWIPMPSIASSEVGFHEDISTTSGWTGRRFIWAREGTAFAFDPATSVWQPITPPPLSVTPSRVSLPDRQGLFVHSDAGDGTALIFDDSGPGTWLTLPTVGGPSARLRPSLAYGVDPVSGNPHVWVMFGCGPTTQNCGDQEASFDDPSAAYDLDLSAWRSIGYESSLPSQMSTCRSYKLHPVALWNDALVVHGGSGFEWNRGTNCWSTRHLEAKVPVASGSSWVRSSQDLAPRALHAFVETNRGVFVYGGRTGANVTYGEAGLLTLVGGIPTFSGAVAPNVPGPPGQGPQPLAPRYGVASLFTGRSVLVWGGARASGGTACVETFNDGALGVHDGTDFVWSPLPPGPSARYGMGTTHDHHIGNTQHGWTGREFILYGGGSCASTVADPGYRYQPPVGCVCPAPNAPAGVATDCDSVHSIRAEHVDCNP